MLVADDELSPKQQRSLEELLNVKVLDRSGIILDIFAQRAHTHEGRIQVELARLEYQLPRLTRMWTHLSRMGGGIGTRRGPGETQLETDRRVLRERIKKTRERVEEVRRRRETAARARERRLLPTMAIVGYTNAGKSTLLNALVGEEAAVVEDMLFATLDPTTRRVRLGEGQTVIVSDTVGFIHKLPHQLVEAFQATLEEVDPGRRADRGGRPVRPRTRPSIAAPCRRCWTSWARATSRGWWCSTRPTWSRRRSRGARRRDRGAGPVVPGRTVAAACWAATTATRSRCRR